jgi:hypothetical protein
LGVVDDGFPHARLCHTIARERLWLVTATYDATSEITFPVDIHRPDPGACAGGFAERTVVCDFCGDQVVLVVYDAEQTSVLRRRWLALGLSGVVLAVLGVLGIACPLGDVSAGSPLLAGLTVAIATGVVLAIGFLRLWREEDGVRFPLRDRKKNLHALRLRPS